MALGKYTPLSSATVLSDWPPKVSAWRWIVGNMLLLYDSSATISRSLFFAAWAMSARVYSSKNGCTCSSIFVLAMIFWRVWDF